MNVIPANFILKWKAQQKWTKKKKIFSSDIFVFPFFLFSLNRHTETFIFPVLHFSPIVQFFYWIFFLVGLWMEYMHKPHRHEKLAGFILTIRCQKKTSRATIINWFELKRDQGFKDEYGGEILDSVLCCFWNNNQG